MSSSNPMNDIKLSNFELKIAQKMALDIRYFCKSISHNIPVCTTPVKVLPTELFNLVRETSLGGVVLFSENLASHEQIIRLTNDLQQAALQSPAGKPLIISIDQEGGRVTRLPAATNLSGNMAVGATYSNHDVHFASQSALVIATELEALGINNNYAPVVDVNTNPDNPVINSRSYGENPAMVAKLGAAAVSSMQENNVMATLKHFPGHGDTHVDSHIGLPIVDRDRESIEKHDLLPFRKIIKKTSPAMVMTAHIQYPALDSSKIVSKDGQAITRTATMSRRILTDLLREEMGFKGIIATDALNMLGVASYFDAETIVVETFKAGADLALMPYTIRSPEDIIKFKHFVRRVANRLANSEIELDEIDQSLERIDRIKSKFTLTTKQSLTSKIDKARSVINSPLHRSIDAELSKNSVTLIKNDQNFLPLDLKPSMKILVMAQSESEKQIITRALLASQNPNTPQHLEIDTVLVSEVTHSCESQPCLSDAEMSKIFDQQLKSLQNKLVNNHLFIITVSGKEMSAVDLGGMDDLTKQKDSQKSKFLAQKFVIEGIKKAYQANLNTVTIVRGSPYTMQFVAKHSKSILSIFDAPLYEQDCGVHADNSLVTSINIITGKQIPLGSLPISL